METKEIANAHYLHPGNLIVSNTGHTVTTVLGSCVSVCLWDPILRTGGINHYMLALWNGEGLPSPKYGNIAIIKLIEKMLAMGSSRQNLKAKVFGGASVIKNTSGTLKVGKRNIILAEDMLRDENISIISSDVGGCFGRKLLFNTATGSVMVKKINPGGNRG